MALLSELGGVIWRRDNTLVPVDQATKSELHEWGIYRLLLAKVMASGTSSSDRIKHMAVLLSGAANCQAAIQEASKLSPEAYQEASQLAKKACDFVEPPEKKIWKL